MEKLTREEIMRAAKKRNYKCVGDILHIKVINAIENDNIIDMLTPDEFEEVASARGNCKDIFDFLKLSDSEKEEIRYNKAVEILKN